MAAVSHFDTLLLLRSFDPFDSTPLFSLCTHLWTEARGSEFMCHIEQREGNWKPVAQVKHVVPSYPLVTIDRIIRTIHVAYPFDFPDSQIAFTLLILWTRSSFSRLPLVKRRQSIKLVSFSCSQEKEMLFYASFHILFYANSSKHFGWWLISRMPDDGKINVFLEFLLNFTRIPDFVFFRWFSPRDIEFVSVCLTQWVWCEWEGGRTKYSFSQNRL